MSPEQLFPRPGGDFLALLAGLPKHLDAAMPMRRQHRRELPGDIRRLSHLLTDERDELKRDYLADPAALSAYLRYFLPWNIYRLGVLFAGLALDPGGDNPEAETTVIDLGAGPLSAALALWMARPHLRRRKLHLICVDRSPKPMRLGLDTLKSLADKHGGLAPWRVTLVKGELTERLRERADLVILANALNEVLHRGEGALLEDAEALATHLTSLLTPTGQLLVVEPGIRPSAHLIAALRRGLMHRGLNPLAPCPHTGPCPMSGRGYTTWCHFNFDATAAPNWLKKLSDEARLAKDNVSLSFLHFSAKGRRLETVEGKSLVRAVSGTFELPPSSGTTGDGSRRFGQYACSERGLTLLSLPNRHLLPLPGTLIEAAWPEAPAKDVKSGALVLPLGQIPGLESLAPTPAPVSDKPEAAAPDKVAKKAPRLPSERPLVRPKRAPKVRPPAQAAAQPDAKSAGKPPVKPGDRPQERSAGKPAGKPAARKPAPPASRPASRPTAKSGGKSGGKTGDEWLAELAASKPESKKPAAAAGQSAGQAAGKPTAQKLSRAARKKAAEQKAAGQKPASQKPASQKATQQKPAGPKPAKKKKAAKKKAAGKKPAAKKPAAAKES